MSNNQPRVSIGLPVYNGENFLKEALDSILVQTFQDFEIIISDNASTDKTEEICRKYAAQDSRIHYYRNEKNLGAAPNYNRVFELSKGEYFKWLAHDDTCTPDLLERCVEFLDQNPSVVLCHSKIRIINAQGKLLDKSDKLYEWVSTGTLKLNTDSPKPHERFRDIIGPHPCYQVFGVIRASALRKTSLIDSYSGSDRILLARLALLGQFYEFPDELLCLRRHLDQSMQALETHRSAHKYTHWFDTSTIGKIILPHWRMFREILISIEQAPLSLQERGGCYLAIIPWLRRSRKGMIEDLILAAKQMSGRLFMNFKKEYADS